MLFTEGGVALAALLVATTGTAFARVPREDSLACDKIGLNEETKFRGKKMVSKYCITNIHNKTKDFYGLIL